jgi:hypothetical protein
VQASLADYKVPDYVAEDPLIKVMGVTRDQVVAALQSVGFSDELLVSPQGQGEKGRQLQGRGKREGDSCRAGAREVDSCRTSTALAVTSMHACVMM